MTKAKAKQSKIEDGQKSLWVENSPTFRKGDTGAATNSKKGISNHEPASELMKIVAGKTMNTKNLEKVFSPEEVREIIMRRNAGEAIAPAEHKAIRERYRKMKRQVKELEKGNKSRIILVPSITNDYSSQSAFFVFR